MKNLKKELEAHRDIFKDSKEELTLNIVLDQVQEKVLEFEKSINKYSEKRNNLITIGKGEVLRLINEIFGDWENEKFKR